MRELESELTPIIQALDWVHKIEYIVNMLTEYIYQKLNNANYKMLEDGTYFGEINDIPGVWASEKKLEDCRESLREVLEEWVVLKLRDGDNIPELTKEINRRINISALRHA